MSVSEFVMAHLAEALRGDGRRHVFNSKSRQDPARRSWRAVRRARRVSRSVVVRGRRASEREPPGRVRGRVCNVARPPSNGWPTSRLAIASRLCDHSAGRGKVLFFSQMDAELFRLVARWPERARGTPETGKRRDCAPVFCARATGDVVAADDALELRASKRPRDLSAPGDTVKRWRELIKGGAGRRAGALFKGPRNDHEPGRL